MAKRALKVDKSRHLTETDTHNFLFALYVGSFDPFFP